MKHISSIRRQCGCLQVHYHRHHRLIKMQRHTITKTMKVMSMMILMIGIFISPLPTSATTVKLVKRQQHQSSVVGRTPIMVTTAAATTTTTTFTATSTNPDEYDSQRRQAQDNINHLRRNHLRRRQQQQQKQKQEERKLPGNAMMGDIDLNSAEAGFIVGFLFLIVLLFLCLCCCCCGGRSRPYGYNNGGGGSNCLWDLVAIVCLWEMCCDNDGILGDGFMRF